jgi:hypothetical protein
MNRRTKMSACWMWLAILAVLICRVASADAPSSQPTTAPTPQVIALVNDLTSDQFSVREKAQQDLEQMGPPVLPQLRRILRGAISDEARTRIGAAMKRIADQQQFGATQITIHCKDAPLQGVLEDFAHQAGADMGIYRPELREYLLSHKITLNLDHADFWTALQAVEDAGGLHRRPDNNGQLILDNMPGFWGGQMGDLSRARIVGPCLIAPDRLNSSMEYDAHFTLFLNLQFSVMIEPKLHVIGSLNANWLRECVDEYGHSLIPPSSPNEEFFYNNGPQWIRTLNATLHPVPQMGKKIARLKGELDFNVQTKSELFIIDNILSAQNVVKNIAGSTITIQQFRDAGGQQYELTATISGPLAASDSQFQHNFLNVFRVFDENNQQFANAGGTQNTDGRGGVMISDRFLASPMGFRPANAQPIGPPKKLQFEIATETRPMSERFEFDDLPLVPPDNGN